MLEILIFFIIFLFGASIGSFISAGVYRLAKKESILSGRSKCTKCKYVLGVFDLIPIFSFLGLRARCRKCKTKIAWEYFFTELITGLIFLFIFLFRYFEFWNPDAFGLLVVRDWILIGGLIFLFIYDLKHQIIPDKVSLPLIFIIFGINLVLGYDLVNLLFAATIGGWWFALQYLLSKGRWVGDGDIRMGVLLGVALGFPNIIFGLFLAYIIGALVSVPIILKDKKRIKGEMAFGTFLAIGGFIALYWGDKIISWYRSLL